VSEEKKTRAQRSEENRAAYAKSRQEWLEEHGALNREIAQEVAEFVRTKDVSKFEHVDERLLVRAILAQVSDTRYPQSQLSALRLLIEIKGLLKGGGEVDPKQLEDLVASMQERRSDARKGPRIA
jgi:hypothetical protein